ncbi:hypothetical protein [Bradyrhizobium sp. SZCCHNS1049]|uniref:hypothetical protein n=1 Tax=unclassified Bradyrhizobium TaxID=2631580 RepID=UPI0039679FA6
MSPHRYVTDRRVRAAQHELARSRPSLVEIGPGIRFWLASELHACLPQGCKPRSEAVRELCFGQIEAIADRPDPNDRRDCS